MVLNGSVYVKKLKAPIYDTSLWIVVGKNIPAAVDALEDYVHFPILAPKDRNSTYALTYQYSDSTVSQRIIIFVTNRSPYGTVAHEALHAVNCIFYHHGVKRDRNNDEHECYYLDTLVTKVHDAISYYNKLKARKKIS